MRHEPAEAFRRSDQKWCHLLQTDPDEARLLATTHPFAVPPGAAEFEDQIAALMLKQARKEGHKGPLFPPSPKFKPLDGTGRAILDALALRPMTSRELAEHTGIAFRSISSMASSLHMRSMLRVLAHSGQPGEAKVWALMEWPQ